MKKRPAQPIPFNQTTVKDVFWSQRCDINRRVTIPHALRMLEEKGDLRNFDLAAQGGHRGYQGPIFMDSDVYKVIEGISYSLATNPHQKLEEQLNAVIVRIESAQMSDGYLVTSKQVQDPDGRWKDLRDEHELYCAGHLIEAGVAHFKATGSARLLEVAKRFADHIDRVFGEGQGKRPGFPGHPEIELALVKLYKVTSEKRYLELASYFIGKRGDGYFATETQSGKASFTPEFYWDEQLIRSQRKAHGHAVRCLYLLAGAVDVARETGDEELLVMVGRVWRNLVERRLYLTGGVGSSKSNEGFTEDFDLPNETAYQETCASVALMMLAHRLHLLTGDSSYMDYFELTLYNAFAAGVSLDGKRFFYDNPLESDGSKERQEWFDCACCPPNVLRLMTSLGGYISTYSEDDLWINLFIGGQTKVTMNGEDVSIYTKTEYPWDGAVQFVVMAPVPVEFSLRLRIPSWCHRWSVNLGGKVQEKIKKINGYAVINRIWSTGDWVELDLEMPVERTVANPAVKENQGKVAYRRGPIVFCAEEADQGAPLASLYIPPGTNLYWEHLAGMLGGIVRLTGECLAKKSETMDWGNSLYCPDIAPQYYAFNAVPYCIWGNREPGKMKVWLPTGPIG